MRTFLYKDYLNDNNGKFLPIQEHESEYFGRHFFIDIAFEFITAPSYKDGGYDEQGFQYVSEMVQENGLDGIDLSKLFDIYRDLTWQENHDSNEKHSSEFASYIDDVEKGNIEYL
jgi:hypothetical protein